jgi:aminoglycoside phosphotransferase (APT) family kinase protein
MRKKPGGKLIASAHAVEREYQVIKALHDNTDVPVPRVYVLCEDLNVIGTPFYIMEFIEGRIFTDLTLGGLPEKERKDCFYALLDTLVKLHKVDPNKIGLEKFGLHGNFYKRQINRMTQTSKQQEVPDKVQPLPHLQEIIKWFEDNIPDDDKTAARIVHGDYKPDNVIFHPTEPIVIGILDWEMSTIGHPLSDLANLCLPYYFKDLEIPLGVLKPEEQPGVPLESDYVDYYTKLIGRPSIPMWGYYTAFACFRLSVILQGIGSRAAKGQASSPAAETIGSFANPVSNLTYSIQQETKKTITTTSKL